MRVRFEVLLLILAGLIAPATASADYVHVVGPGESLSSIAAADGLSVAQLAAANGLSPSAQLVSGSGLQIPPQIGGATLPSTTTAPASTAVAPAATTVVGDGDADSDDVAVAPVAPAAVSTGDGDNDGDDTAGSPAAAAPAAPSGGSYVVQPGDTLSAIAACAGMSLDQLAAANGLDPAAALLAGTVLRLSASGPAAPIPVSTPVSATSAATSQPVGPAAQGSAVNPPYPTPQTVSPSEVGTIAAANGVPPSLAQAIAYQESGFNNAAVSTSDARGVMQILPGTWNWIQQTLVPGASPLAPASATDNVRGGVLLLHSLLNATGGNAALAAAGYYQGLPSVQANGMYPSTQQYVNNVLALQQQFAGGG